MKMSRWDWESMHDHARRGYPHEVCGVLLGRPSGTDLRVEGVAPVANREEASPATRYVIAPEELLAVQRDARQRGLEIAGYYHSHPDHPARPSETDRRLAAEGISDGVVHVVVAVDRNGRTEATAWVFRDAHQSFEPLALAIEARQETQEQEDAWP